MKTDDTVLATVLAQRTEAATKAWQALAGYKFWMFGHYAARWVGFNQLLPADQRAANPFRALVDLARRTTNWTAPPRRPAPRETESDQLGTR